ncbi:hypothetical protein F5Y05DRAFT_267513 [Hypoxylon sp. FL0543]|nr:hypothetical protein F5Y05DRAFT_267513 [Hypoxylon sp. FL0543]
MVEKLPREDMPHEYTDTVVLTLRLRLRYWWIDTLVSPPSRGMYIMLRIAVDLNSLEYCIIQDSDDWDHECGTMDMVYQHAYCNLAATSAVESSEGLFYKRSLSQVHPQNISLSDSEELALVTDDSDTRVFSNLDREALNFGGWVRQERLPSTRNVSFTRRLEYF